MATARINALCTELGTICLRGGKGQPRCRVAEGEPRRPRKRKDGGGRFSALPQGGMDPTTKAGAGQDIVRWHTAKRKAQLFSPHPRAWDEGFRKTAFGYPMSTHRTTRSNDDRSRHLSCQRKRPALPRTPNPNPPRCHGHAIKPDRRRFLGISHNAPGCRTRSLGAAFAPLLLSKCRDRARVGRKER